MKINVLGTEYMIIRVDKGQDPYIEENSLGGYCSYNTKEIVLLNLKTSDLWKDEPEEAIKRQEKKTLRHEIIHAFLNESGLHAEAHVPTEGWACNEEMIDWFAIQIPKIIAVFKVADCI